MNFELGPELVRDALISDQDLTAAEEIAAGANRKLSSVLVEEGFIDCDALGSAMTLRYGIGAIDLSRTEIQPEATALVPEATARELRAIPVTLEVDRLIVAMEDPLDSRATSALTALTKKRIDAVVAVGMSIEEAIAGSYTLRGQIEQRVGQIIGPNGKPRAEAANGSGTEVLRDSPVIQAVDMMLAQAVRERASDIHIEPQGDVVLVRNRIDGVLHEAVRLPLGVHSAVMTRIKVMANLNIAERRRPQDGQFGAEIGGKNVDFRVATVEGSYGEMAVLRVLDKSMLLMKLSDLGLGPAVVQPFEKLLASPFGMIVVSGPTGSGKTTTLYAALQHLDAEQRNVMTIEDPIEYGFKGINQIQVNRQANITFPVGLRAIMRHDPDIILVGEIRDNETATTAVQAAITGHLVLTSIHANDAVSALLRLVDMGVEPFLVSSAVIGSLSQRLVRRVCTYCGQPAEVSPPEAAAYQAIMDESRERFLVGRGCNFCARSGFLGRIGAFELLTMNDEIRKMAVHGTPASMLREEAIRSGMVPIRTDAMQKVRDGVTTAGEAVRNVFTVL